MFKVEDVRNYINTTLMGSNLTYVIDPSFEMNVTHYDKVGNQHTTQVLSIEKNSVASRPRLFGRDRRPIELSYCDEWELCNTFRDYRRHLQVLESNRKRTEVVEFLTQYANTNFQKMVEVLGLRECFIKVEDFKLLEHVSEGALESLTLNELSKVKGLITTLQHVKDMIEKFDGREYQELSMEERIEYHRIKFMQDGDCYRVHKDIEDMLRDAVEVGITELVMYSASLWDNDVNDFLKVTRELGYTTFYIGQASSLVKDILYQMLSNGCLVVWL